MFYPSSYCLWRHNFIIDPDAAKTRLGIGNVLKYFTTFTSFTCQSEAESAVFVCCRVPNWFFGIRDLTFLEPGIRDSKEYWERDSGLHL